MKINMKGATEWNGPPMTHTKTPAVNAPLAHIAASDAAHTDEEITT